MPLAIYRRHSPDCQFYGRARRDSRSQKCQCAIWVQGSLGSQYLRRTLDLTSWSAAQELVRGWEASGEVGVVQTEIPEVPDAVERFFEDIKARGLSEATVGKQNVLLRKQFLPWCKIARLQVAEAAQRRRDHAVPGDVGRRPTVEVQETGTPERLLPLLRRARVDAHEPRPRRQAGQGAAIADAAVRRGSRWRRSSTPAIAIRSEASTRPRIARA